MQLNKTERLKIPTSEITNHQTTMRQNLIYTLAIASALTLTACSTPGGGFLNTNVQTDAGAEPTNYEQVIRSSLNTNKNISNIVISKPELASCAVGIYGSFHGWRVATSYTTTQHTYGNEQIKLQVNYYWFHGESLKGIGQARDFCADAPAWLR